MTAKFFRLLRPGTVELLVKSTAGLAMTQGPKERREYFKHTGSLYLRGRLAVSLYSNCLNGKTKQSDKLCHTLEVYPTSIGDHSNKIKRPSAFRQMVLRFWFVPINSP